jgi:hypothetical protein
MSSYEINVSIHLYDSVTGNRFTLNNTYNIQINEFATLDNLNRKVNDVVREFLPDETNT